LLRKDTDSVYDYADAAVEKADGTELAILVVKPAPYLSKPLHCKFVAVLFSMYIVAELS
jgi:hypothetical protein